MSGPSSPPERRATIVEAIVRARTDGEPVVFSGEGATVEYHDRTLRLELETSEADRLESLRSTYPVIKPKQPETRKAPNGVVVLSAVTDPKHAADFLDDLFLTVFGAAERYELAVERRDDWEPTSSR